MKQKFKRLLSALLAIVMVFSGLQFSGWTQEAKAATLSNGTTIYFDTNGVEAFTHDGAVPSVLFKQSKTDSYSTFVKMTLVEGTSTIYSATVSRDNVTDLVFRRSSSSNEDWKSATTILSVLDGYNCFKLNSWTDSSTENANGYWYKYTSSSEDSSSTSNTVYFDPSGNGNAGWGENDQIYVYAWTDGNNSGIQAMTKSNGLYSYTFTTKYANIIFLKQSSFPEGDDKSSKTTDQEIPWSSCSSPMFVLTGEYDGVNGGTKKGVWSDANTSYYYVNTDLVDYFNDAYIESGNSADQQGNALGSKADNNGGVAFSYFNNAISGNNYTNPLYFGSLLFLDNRVGRSFLKSGAYEPLKNWNSMSNVAFAYANGTENLTASVQGLVYKTLGSNGALLDVDGKTELPYFSQTIANNWTLSGSDNKKFMKYYSGLSFPFKAQYDAANGITTYSYDSATDYAVYYDGTTTLKTSASHTANVTQNSDSTDEWGYYPFNTPGETDRSKINYGFGTKFTINFTINKNGTLDGTKDGEPITFEFTGDDDVWVFLDGKLVLDMGGAHAKASGVINFKDKKATVTNAVTVDASQKIRGNSNDADSYSGLDNYLYNNNTKERSKVATTAKETTFDACGVDFDDYGETHTLTMFYMERGMFDSNMSVKFTITPLPSGLSVGKTVDTTNVNAGLKDAVSEMDNFEFTLNSDDVEESGIFYSLKNNYGDVKINEALTNGTTITGVNQANTAYNFVDKDGADAFKAGNSVTISEVTTKKTTLTYDKTTYKVLTSDTDNATDGKTGKSVSIEDMKPVDYSVIFNNVPVTKDVTVTKAWSGDDVPEKTEFTFKVEVALDGENYKTYPLGYTINGNSATTETDGTFLIKANQTATFKGIPVNAKVRVTETVEGTEAWYVVGEASKEITVSDSASSITITNRNKVNKVVYMEAEDTSEEDTTDTEGIDNYEVIDSSNNEKITITEAEVTSSSETTGEPAISITVDVNSDGTLDLHSPKADETYVISYKGTEGEGDDKINVAGTITVYTYKATKKVYVFDYGLKSNIAAINDNEDGLFEGGVFYNEYTKSDDGAYTTSASLSEIAKADTTQTQTAISITAGENDSKAINSDGTFAGEVVFTPNAFMSQVESYTYKAIITAGEKYDENKPETGTAVNGTIKVMPASVVYYEDNFNATGENDGSAKIIYTKTTNAPTTGVTLVQSNNQSEQYGYDEAYVNGTGFSAGSATEMEIGARAYFQFTGTGFDILSRTDRTAGNLLVYVYDATKSKLIYDETEKTASVTNFAAGIMSIMTVSNYYENGDLYQVPVIHKDMDEHGTYIVEIVSLCPSNESATVYIDGIRIYNPLKTGDDAYIDNEKDAELLNIREALFGADFVFNYDDPVDSTWGAEEVVASLVKEVVTDETKEIYYLSGKTVVEAYRTEKDVAVENPDVANDLLTYAVQGPNNELYLDNSGYSVGFMASTKEEDAASTIQVGMKVVSGSEITIQRRVITVKDPIGTWEDWATVKSATEKYYVLDTDVSKYLDPEADDEVLGYAFRVSPASLSGGIISITNLKIQNYTLEPLAIVNTDEETVDASLNPNTFKFTSGYSTAKGFRKDKTVFFTCRTPVDVEDIKIFSDVSGSAEVNITSKSFKVVNSTDGSYQLWTIRFKTPATQATYFMKAYGSNGNYSELVEFGKGV